MFSFSISGDRDGLVPRRPPQCTPVLPPPIVDGLLPILASFAPLWAALLVSSRRLGGQGVRSLLSQIFRWRTGLDWYALALAGPMLQGCAPAANRSGRWRQRTSDPGRQYYGCSSPTALPGSRRAGQC